MLIKEIVDKYVKIGHFFKNAQNLAAEEITLNKIASSSLAEHVTLKGGIVMFNLTKNYRRVTQDIDFDFIRYSINEVSIKSFVNKLNSIKDGISVFIDDKIEPLHQEDYQGVRVHLILQDVKSHKLKIKLDIGIHTYSAIEQERIIFTFVNSDKAISMKVNPPEQIFIEKLISLARLGPISTRYKDIYDLYYLINNQLLDIKKVKNFLELFFSSSKRKPNDINELVNSIIDTFDNQNFAKEASEPTFKWIDVDYEAVKLKIISFISKI